MLISFNHRSYCHELDVQSLKSLKVVTKIKECLEQKKFKQYSATISHANLAADKVKKRGFKKALVESCQDLVMCKEIIIFVAFSKATELF